MDNSKKAQNVGILNWWYVNNKGAILTNYALNELIKEFNYIPYTVNYIHPCEQKNFINSYAEDFAKKYLNLTPRIDDIKGLKTLNNSIGTFVVGSDQIFRYPYCHAHGDIFYLNWADANENKLLSYSASFATNIFEADKETAAIVGHWLNRFDAHSIRELDGVDIMKNSFNIDSTQVLDPVFCINKEKYEELAQKSSVDINDDFIAYYVLGNGKDKQDIVDYVSQKLNIKTKIALNRPMPIEDWLWYFINAKFIVTDSFHGSCFSLIFNKQFISLPTRVEYPSRYLTLDKISGLTERFLYKYETIYANDNLFDAIDYTNVNKKISKEIERSKLWLKNALVAPKTKFPTIEDQLFRNIFEKQESLKEDILLLKNDVISLKSNLNLILNKGKIYRKYYFYKILSSIALGKLRIKFNEKKAKYKNLKREICKILKY